ncbi:MAG: TonB-dependent receptor [Flavobacteriales bacterium]
MAIPCATDSSSFPGKALSTLRRPAVVLALLFLGTLLHAQVDSTLNALPDTTQRNEPRIPVFTITADDLDSELGGQEISGILQSSRDVFTATAGFNFGSARFRIRGFDSENTLVSINGVLVNDLETGWATWSSWGGLNDVTRWMQVRTGVGPSRFNFGSIGGYTELNVRPSQLRKGLRVSYASTNRAYRNRVMATYSTGMQQNGWAFSASGSRRWAEEGYVEGTSFNAYAYFLAAEKKINDKHSISFSGFGAPIVQGRQGLAVQEAYDLAGTNYYNPNWGYQDGEKRNAQISFDHKPLFMATHVYKPTTAAVLTTSLFYTFGRDGLSRLNWNDAKDPRPDYYRYLPSYYSETDPAAANALANGWANGSQGQIDWDQLYFANGKNLYTVENANGTGGNITGNRSKYILEEQRADPTRIGINSVYSKELEKDAHVTYGGSINIQRTHYFKVIDDLLGGDFWVDVDQFAQRDFNDTTVAQNDLDTPNKVVGEGDIFGYDYDIHNNLYNGFFQYEKSIKQWELYGGAQMSYTSFWRNSRFRNGRFPDDSFGKSEAQTFFHYGVKAGATYKVTGRHFVVANAAFLTRPPISRSAYVSPRTRDQVLGDLQNEKALSGDIGYVVRFPRLKGRATLYYAQIKDQVWARSFYHDEYLTLINYTMNGVDQTHQGVELGIEANLSSTWQMTAVYAGGDYRYSSRPTANITRDNSTEVFATDRTVYWKNYRVGGMPQTAASLGFRYNSPKFWFAGVSANYFDDIYLDPNPDRRTTEALANFVDTDPQWDALLEQTQLDANMTVDLFAGKSWIVKGYRIAVNVTVSNLLDNQEFRIGGFEQLRYDRTDVGRFPPKYSYLYGRNYFAMVTFSF